MSIFLSLILVMQAFQTNNLKKYFPAMRCLQCLCLHVVNFLSCHTNLIEVLSKFYWTNMHCLHSARELPVPDIIWGGGGSD